MYQETDYWCGPASAQQLLAAQGVHVSQQQLANELRTTENGTDSVTNFPAVLNRHMGWSENPTGNEPGYRAAFIGGNRNLFLQRIYEDTRTGDPMIYNIKMSVIYGAGDGHYVTGNGWREKDGALYDLIYVDPWYGVHDDKYKGLKTVDFDLLCSAIEGQYGGYVW